MTVLATIVARLVRLVVRCRCFIVIAFATPLRAAFATTAINSGNHRFRLGGRLGFGGNQCLLPFRKLYSSISGGENLALGIPHTPLP
jgi:hypothetical protein